MIIEKIQTLFSYNAETGVLVRVKSKRRNFLNKPIKNEIWIDGKKLKLTHAIWAFTYGKLPTAIIDHINGNHQDNRLCNLREATAQQNQFNKERYGLLSKGVVRKRDANRSKPYAARIRIQGKKICLGQFATEQEAAEAYRKKAEEIQKEFAVHLSRI